MNWWESILLGFVQGLTEFLPVSSSGHLVLGQHLLGLQSTEGDVLFEVLLHFGTIMSVFWVYRNRIWTLTSGFLSRLVHVSDWGESYTEDGQFRLGVMILITMVPTLVVYVLWGEYLESAFSSPKLAAGMLLVTGTLLMLTRLRKSPSGNLTAPKSFLIGVAQAAAMIPGISRSGATICTAIYQDVEPTKAADFSFLILLPVVLGATIIKVGEALAGFREAEWGILLLGTFVAFVSGIIAIKLVLEAVRKGQLQYFAVYCFLAGGIGLYLL